MKTLHLNGFCNFANKECSILVNVPHDSDLENSNQRTKISRINCDYFKIVRCNPRKCPILESNHLEF